MVFIDVHAHLDFYDDKKVEDAIKRAKEKGIGIIIDNSTRANSMERVLKLGEKYPEIKVALGIYPIDALSLSEEELNEKINFIRINKKKIIAIGEVGLDLKENAQLEKQTEIFKKFINLAIELKKPIIVHSRKAEKEAIEELENSGIKRVVMHCFSGNLNLLKRAESNDWLFSIPTNVKFSEHFQNAIKNLPITQLLCETDTPFLHPDKEKDNEPANVIEAYKKIAEIKGFKIEEVEEMIEENYRRLFG